MDKDIDTLNVLLERYINIQRMCKDYVFTNIMKIEGLNDIAKKLDKVINVYCDKICGGIDKSE
jgi:hypothetical protein